MSMRAYNPTYRKSGKRYNKEHRLISRSILRSMKSELLSFIKSADNSIVLTHGANKYLFLKDNTGRVYCHIPDSVLGDGTYGVACVCQDIVTGQVYCLKVMKEDFDPSEEIDMANQLYNAEIYNAPAHRVKISDDAPKQYLYDDINSKYENGLSKIKGSHYAAILPYLEGVSLDKIYINQTVPEETPERKPTMVTIPEEVNPETDVPDNQSEIITRSRENTCYAPDDERPESDVMSPITAYSDLYLDRLFAEPGEVEQDYLPRISNTQFTMPDNSSLQSVQYNIASLIGGAKKGYTRNTRKYIVSEKHEQELVSKKSALRSAKTSTLKNVNPKDLFELLSSWLDLAVSSVQALESLHKNGFIHCDIKPENLMYDTENVKATLCDLGNILKLERTDLGLTHRVLDPQAHGTIYCMAPELKSIMRKMNAFSPYYRSMRGLHELLSLPVVVDDLEKNKSFKCMVDKSEIVISQGDTAIQILKNMGIDEPQAYFDYSDKADIYSLGFSVEITLSHLLLMLTKPNAEFTAADVDSADALLPAKFEASAENKDAVQLLEQAVKVMHELQAEDPKARISLTSAASKLQALKQRTHDLMQQYKVTPDIWHNTQQNIAAAISESQSESEVDRFKISSSEKDKVIIQDHVGTYPTQKIIVTNTSDEIKTSLPKQWFDKNGVILDAAYQKMILNVIKGIETAMPGCEMTIRKCKTKPQVAQVIHNIMTEKGIVAHYDVDDGTAAAVAALELPTAGPASPSSQLSQ